MSGRTPSGMLALIGAASPQSPTTRLRAATSGAATTAFETNDASVRTHAAGASPSPLDPTFLDDDALGANAVLTVEDVAELTRVGRNTIYSLVARNQIPHRRMGKQIRFSRAAVMSWLATSWQGAKEGK